MGKINVVYTSNVYVYSAFKKKPLKMTLPFVTTWMKLGDIVLSEINETPKDKLIHDIPPDLSYGKLFFLLMVHMKVKVLFTHRVICVI